MSNVLLTPQIYPIFSRVLEILTILTSADEYLKSIRRK
jgi:hypothetical protein